MRCWRLIRGRDVHVRSLSHQGQILEADLTNM
jgi:hypothetical protein